MRSNTQVIRTEEEFEKMLHEIAEEILLEKPDIVNGCNSEANSVDNSEARKSPAFLTLEGYVELLGDSSLYEVMEAVLMEVIDANSLFRLKFEIEEVRKHQNKLNQIDSAVLDALWDKTKEA